MLLSENLGGCHDRALVSTLDRHEQRSERDDRLARSDLSLQEAMHRMLSSEIRADLADHAFLGPGEGVGQRAQELIDERSIDGVNGAARLLSLALLPERERDLESEQLVEDQAFPCTI